MIVRMLLTVSGVPRCWLQEKFVRRGQDSIYYFISSHVETVRHRERVFCNATYKSSMCTWPRIWNNGSGLQFVPTVKPLFQLILISLTLNSLACWAVYHTMHPSPSTTLRYCQLAHHSLTTRGVQLPLNKITTVCPHWHQDSRNTSSSSSITDWKLICSDCTLANNDNKKPLSLSLIVSKCSTFWSSAYLMKLTYKYNVT